MCIFTDDPCLHNLNKKLNEATIIWKKYLKKQKKNLLIIKKHMINETLK